MSPCTAAELAALRTPAGAYRGVYRHESGRSAQAWRAEPVKRVRLGTYRTAREAAAEAERRRYEAVVRQSGAKVD